MTWRGELASVPAPIAPNEDRLNKAIALQNKGGFIVVPAVLNAARVCVLIQRKSLTLPQHRPISRNTLCAHDRRPYTRAHFGLRAVLGSAWSRTHATSAGQLRNVSTAHQPGAESARAPAYGLVQLPGRLVAGRRGQPRTASFPV